MIAICLVSGEIAFRRSVGEYAGRVKSSRGRRDMISVLGRALGLSALAVLMTSPAGAEDGFYKGKRLTVMVNYAPGGPTDIEGRLFARHIAKHLDGNPPIIVQNMDGAGGLIGTGWLGEIAPKDGTLMGYLTGAAWVYANEPEKHRVDLRSYEFVAYQPGTTVYYVRSDVKPGLKEAADIVKAQGLVSGGLAADNSKDLLIRLSLDMLGVPFRHVTGYRSNQTARLALQQGEINFFAESPPGYRSVVEPSLVKDGTVVPTYYDPGWNGESLGVPKQIEGLAILPFHELYKKIKGKEPSGQLWDVYLASLAINSAMQRLLVLPPNVPQASLDTLRAALRALNQDSAFAEDAMKAIGFVPEYVAGPDTNRQVRQALTVRPEIRAFVADYVKNGPRK
jgi:tripartite-type tricarboxylate transporter receptor subunit TctC